MTNSAEFLDSNEAVKEEVQETDQKQEVPKQQDESLFNDLVGEGKKFADSEALAKAKAESDTHIKTIEEENAELRKKLEASSNNYEAILDKLEAKENQDVSVPTKDALDNSSAPEEEEIDIYQLVDSVLDERQQKKVEKANMVKSKDLMVEAYGNVETAKQVRDEFLKEKPYMQDVLNDLISNDPEQMLKEMVQFKSPEEVGDVATDPVSGVPKVHVDGGSKYVTWTEAQKVFKTDKKRYTSKEFTKLKEDSEAYYKSKGVDYFTQT